MLPNKTLSETCYLLGLLFLPVWYPLVPFYFFELLKFDVVIFYIYIFFNINN